MPRRLQDWLVAHAQARPEAPAIVSASGTMSYGELDARSSQVARLLREAGCRRGDRVGLLTQRSAMSIVGLLGAYKADAVAVPMDPLSPAARLGKILTQAEAGWVLAEQSVSAPLADLGSQSAWEGRIGWMDQAEPIDELPTAFCYDDLLRAPADLPDSVNGPGDPAHILFTSGSTGMPKGVVICHANVVGFIEWAVRHFGIAAGDRLSAHTALHFDIAFLDVFGAQAAGSELHLVPRELNLLPNKMVEFIREHRLTQWFSAPSILNYLAKFDVLAQDDFPELKRVLWCGEVLPTPALIYWMQHVPHASYTNLYGPTETTIASSYYTVPSCPADPRAAVPIGVPCDGEELLVLDDGLRPVPPDVTGDLYIGGSGLARGYWRDPERTNAVYIPHPLKPGERLYRTGDLARRGEDGLFYFLGRNDTQIKSRGYRIELGEIEAATHALEALRDSAVVAIRSEGFESVTICCAYVPVDPTLTPARLKRLLADVLPGYMLPTRWQAFDRLPQNASGKVDRPALTRLFTEQTEPHALPTV